MEQKSWEMDEDKGRRSWELAVQVAEEILNWRWHDINGQRWLSPEGGHVDPTVMSPYLWDETTKDNRYVYFDVPLVLDDPTEDLDIMFLVTEKWPIEQLIEYWDALQSIFQKRSGNQEKGLQLLKNYQTGDYSQAALDVLARKGK